MAAPANTRYLHVANGTSTTALIEAAGIPGVLSIWADPLYEGPVPGGLSDDELLDVRARHLAGSNEAPARAVNDLRAWRSIIAQHGAYDELVLWYEHDLFDQLNLVQVLSWIGERVPRGTRVSLVSAGSFPGRPDFKGFGELTSAELSPLLQTRRPVTDAQYSLAARAWHAFRESTPEPLDAFRHDDLSALPFLRAALTRFLEEYPWTIDGLSRSERRLLQVAAGEGTTLLEAFARMHDGENAYYVTDMSLAGLAANLSSASTPLLRWTPPSADRGILSAHVTLTPAGAAVLAGERDRVDLCGIDRWLGGVHVHDAARLWRWDPARQCIVR